MKADIECERCKELALPAPIHLGGVTLRLCGNCFSREAANWVAAHPEEAEVILGSLGIAVSQLGPDEAGRQMVAAFDRAAGSIPRGLSEI